jgi:hypothetical protein
VLDFLDTSSMGVTDTSEKLINKKLFINFRDLKYIKIIQKKHTDHIRIEIIKTY